MTKSTQRLSPAAYKYTYSLVCCARWEQQDIVEWVCYHQSVGFDHIYLLCNDDDPAPTFKALLPFLLGDTPLVTFRHFPKGSQTLPQQADIYECFLRYFKDETEWFAFLDVDEFFVFKGVDNVARFMRERSKTSDAIYFNWLLYGHSGKMSRDHESILLSHVQRSRSVDPHTKMIVRSSSIDADALLSTFRAGALGFWHFLDCYDLKETRKVNVLGDDMEHYSSSFPAGAAAYLTSEKSQAIINTAYVAHYQFKSESDIMRRVERGGSNTNARWKEYFENGSYKALLSARSESWDVYLAQYWLKVTGDAYDFGVQTLCRHPAKNVALRKPTFQSSWYRPAIAGEEKGFPQGHVNTGIRTGMYGFKTAFQDQPWLLIDLLESALISEMKLYGDITDPARSLPRTLGIAVSSDLVAWTKVYDMGEDDYGSWVESQPLVVAVVPALEARFVRLALKGLGHLQMDEIEIYRKTRTSHE